MTQQRTRPAAIENNPHTLAAANRYHLALGPDTAFSGKSRDTARHMQPNTNARSTHSGVPAPPRTTRPLYLAKLPTPIWERVHINAILSGLPLQDYLARILERTEPLSGQTQPARETRE